MSIRVVVMTNHVTPSIIWNLSSCHPPIARLNVCWWQIVWATRNQMFSVVHLSLDRSYWSAYWHLWNIDHRIFTTDYFFTYISFIVRMPLAYQETSGQFDHFKITQRSSPLFTSHYIHSKTLHPGQSKILFPLHDPMTKAFKHHLQPCVVVASQHSPWPWPWEILDHFFLTCLWSRVQ